MKDTKGEQVYIPVLGIIGRSQVILSRLQSIQGPRGVLGCPEEFSFLFITCGVIPNRHGIILHREVPVLSIKAYQMVCEVFLITHEKIGFCEYIVQTNLSSGSNRTINRNGYPRLAASD